MSEQCRCAVCKATLKETDDGLCEDCEAYGCKEVRDDIRASAP
jgi:hypothetical protein